VFFFIKQTVEFVFIPHHFRDAQIWIEKGKCCGSGPICFNLPVWNSNLRKIMDHLLCCTGSESSSSVKNNSVLHSSWLVHCVPEWLAACGAHETLGVPGLVNHAQDEPVQYETTTRTTLRDCGWNITLIMRIFTGFTRSWCISYGNMWLLYHS
jgi:hypothetical protein